MEIIASYLRKAAKLSANENQLNMLLKYAKSFEEGSLQVFKESQRLWIRDKKPAVEYVSFDLIIRMRGYKLDRDTLFEANDGSYTSSSIIIFTFPSIMSTVKANANLTQDVTLDS